MSDTADDLDPAGALRCPECSDAEGRDVFAPARGKMAPAAVLGMHRKQAHGVEGSSAKAQRRRDKADDVIDVGNVRPLRAADVTAAVGAKKSPPKADDLARGFARIDGYVSVTVIGALVDADPRPLSDGQRDALIGELAPSAEHCLATWRPFARIAAGTQLNKRYGRTLVENLDWADFLAALGTRSRPIMAYLRDRRAWAAGGGPADVGPGPMPAQAGPDAFMGPSAAYGAPEGMRGVVVTPDMLAGRANGGGGPVTIAGAGMDG